MWDLVSILFSNFFFFQAEDGIRDVAVTGVQTCALPISTSDRNAELVMARANAIFNQLYVVSLNAAAPAALGRSVIVDPEGIVRLRAGDSERSEERRVGKEWRCRRLADQLKINDRII